MRAIIIDLLRRALGTKQISERLSAVEEKEVRILDRIDQALPAVDPDSVAKGVRLTISSSDPTSYFRCEFNGELAWLPTETLRTMMHCMTAANNRIVLQVETAHINWMIDRLGEGNGNALFIDVGAATGAATIPIALRFKQNVSIVAFEPAINAMRLLSATIEKNHISSSTLVKAAVSDVVGEVTFVEYGQDSTGNNSWLPETSSIAHQGARTTDCNIFSVKSVTLDNYFSLEGSSVKSKFNAVVVKIDVEGFEGQVLRGAFIFIEEYRPYFSIDIHNRIEGEGTTEKDCRDLLSRFEYTFEKMGHVLLASPK